MRNNKNKNRFLVLAIPVFLILIFFPSCSGKESKQEPESPEASSWRQDTHLAWPALALLQTGENPLWFEYGEGGPLLIESPSAASLTPYAPWPHARFTIGMQVWNGFLVMAVNRDGFTVIGRGRYSEEAVLYRVTGGSFWDPYTAESFFCREGKPALLLYRNDFFSEIKAPPLRPQVYILDSYSPVPLGVSVPALEIVTEADGSVMEAELMRRGNDGFWYYRMKEKGKANAAIAYFTTHDLREEGERIYAGQWRNSNRPENPEYIPRHFAAVLGKLAEFGLAKVNAVKIVSPDFEEERIFALSAEASIGPMGGASANENPSLLFGFCESTEPVALVITQQGQGIYSAGKQQGVFSFSLPSLPEGFFYTGVAVLGNVLVASWEEQQEAGIGAAGFMTVDVTKLIK